MGNIVQDVKLPVRGREEFLQQSVTGEGGKSSVGAVPDIFSEGSAF